MARFAAVEAKAIVQAALAFLGLQFTIGAKEIRNAVSESREKRFRRVGGLNNG
jgi:hypothetical protein